MSMRISRNTEPKRDNDVPAELESQIILRLPPEPARILREAIRSGAVHLKDRLSIKIENDMRYGEVRVDHWLLHAKVVDLPSVIESLKTIDNKSFYKTADICQLLICKEDDDQTTTDEESPSKTKKKDPNKVDKKFLWPHGVTPPLKNVRRRRFRKTLKKKYVEAPEIEKEVKRLLRVDNDAVNVKWEVICEDEEKKSGIVKVPFGSETGEGDPGPSGDASLEASNPHSVDVAEHELFGEAVSDSEEEEANINIVELEEETSRPSAEDSRMSDSASLQGTAERHTFVTEFSKDMFTVRSSYPDRSKQSSSHVETVKEEPQPEFSEVPPEFQPPVKSEEISFDFDLLKAELNSGDEPEYGSSSDMSRVMEPPSPAFQASSASVHRVDGNTENIRARLDVLEKELADLRHRRQQQELEIANIENHALRQRFQDILDNLLTEMLEKEQEYQELTSLMQM